MNFDYTPKVRELQARLAAFMAARVYPNERRFRDEVEGNRAKGNPWIPTRLVEELKVDARAAGLWNLFLPQSVRGAGLTNLEYAPLAEIMGRVTWAPEIFNCSAPDTGNMETIERYGTPEQKRQWLEPLLAGEIRSAFLMTEPAVASSDATNIECSMVKDGDHYVINGRKWWSSGAGDPRCRIYIVMGKTDPGAPKHRQQSMLLVPAAAPGVSVIRPLTVFNADDAPHGHMEIDLADVRVPAGSVLKGEGCGFEIAQGRLGPGRIHHCMRLVGLAERALELMCRRLSSRVAFGGEISRQTVWQERIAESRCIIEQARLLVLKAAYLMDTVGNKVAKKEIAMIKVVAPNVACKVIDWAIQAYGAAGVHDEFLVGAYASARSLRLADGPDEVHRNAIAKIELREIAGGTGGGNGAAAASPRVA
jgi:acyl-CoA dehydrogenase